MATNFTITENVTRSIQEDTSTYQASTTPRMEMDETSVPVPTNYDNLSKDLFNCSGNFTNQTEFGTNMAPQSCSDWQDAQHALFQLANLCLIISFLTPSSFKHHSFFLRLIISFGYLFFGLWGGVFVCMPDVLVWNIGFLVINVTHLAYLGCRMCPIRLGKLTQDLYEKMFKPLRVDRERYKTLTLLGDTYLLTKGSGYATEGRTKCGNKLSILLKGR